MIAPSTRTRLGAAVAIGCVAALCTYWGVTTAAPSDFEVWWRATRLLTRGVDPYKLGPGSSGWPFDGRLLYPLPALLVTVPVAGLPLALAAAVSLGLVTAALAYVLTRDGWWRLYVFVTPMYIWACKLGQWSPLLTLAALVPALAWLAPVKPTLGVAMYAWRLDWRGALLGLVLTIASIALLPMWPREWLANLRTVVGHPPPILTPLGAPLALAALRWRTREGRLLLALACVPQLLMFADQVPVALTARTAREQLALTVCSLVACCAWWLPLLPLRPDTPYVALAAPYVLAGVYLPALVVVLRRPNVGELPAAPAWLARFTRSRAGVPRAARRQTSTVAARDS